MKKTASLIFILVWLGGIAGIAGESNPWGSLKKIRFFGALGDEEKTQNVLSQTDGSSLPRGERIEWIRQMLQVGDAFYAEKKIGLAEAVYEKIMQTAPGNWWVINRLEQIRRFRGAMIPSPANIWQQAKRLAFDFSSSLFIVNGLCTLLFASLLLAFLFFALFVMWKYFLLVLSDFLQHRKASLFSLRLLLFVAIFAWPFFVGGWGVFPFLITGFFWIYMESTEKKTATWFIALALFLSFVFGAGKWLEKRAIDPRFQQIQRLYYGMEPLSSGMGENPGNEEKLLMATSEYERHDTSRAIALIESMSPKFRNHVKENLLGILNFETGQVEESIKHFRESLRIQEKNEAALRNLTLAILKSENPDQIRTFINRYPAMEAYKVEFEHNARAVPSMTLELPPFYLWNKIVTFPHSNFHILTVLKVLALPMAWLPLLAYILLFVLLKTFTRRLFPFIGQSEFCSKCSKILRRKMFEHVHVLCDDCYQLFMVKEAIFFDAKILKEKEIGRRQRRKGLAFHLISLLVPGFALNYYEKTRAFLFFSWATFFLGGCTLYFSLVFRRYFAAVPLFLFPLGILALLIYLAANLYALKGLDDGF